MPWDRDESGSIIADALANHGGSGRRRIGRPLSSRRSDDPGSLYRTTTAALDLSRTVELPIQRATREQLLAGMCGIIRRMMRVTPRGDLVLVDHDERELAIELLAYLEGVKRHG